MRKLIWLIPTLATYAVPGWGAPVHADLEFPGITFAIDCPNSSSLRVWPQITSRSQVIWGMAR